MKPHIILCMNKIDVFKEGKIIPSYYLFESDTDDNVMIFKNFNEAKKYQDDNAVDGRVVPLPIY
jgi:hypothetical protein